MSEGKGEDVFGNSLKKALLRAAFCSRPATKTHFTNKCSFLKKTISLIASGHLLGLPPSSHRRFVTHSKGRVGPWPPAEAEDGLGPQKPTLSLFKSSGKSFPLLLLPDAQLGCLHMMSFQFQIVLNVCLICVYCIKAWGKRPHILAPLLPESRMFYLLPLKMNQ